MDINKLDKIKKVADVFTDSFSEQIEDILLDYGLHGTEEEVDEVLKEVVRIYKYLI